MSAVYQLVFFLSIGLFAVVITVFVLAVSLLGRAVNMAIEGQEKANKEQKEADEKELGKIQGELSEAKEEGRRPDVQRLSKAINSLKRKKRINNWKLKWINAKPKFLGALWGAFIPGAFLLTSAIISIVAIYIGNGTPEMFPYLLIAGIALGVGICFICLSLKVIEGVARVSEDVAFQRDVDIFKTSLRDVEKEKKAKLALQFHKESPPFHVKADSVVTIDYTVGLIEGKYVDDVRLFFFAPKGFDFPGQPTLIQPEDSESAPGYLTAIINIQGSILRNIIQPGRIGIKMPSEADKYPLYYRVFCRGGIGVYEKFEIVVEEKDVSGD